MKKLLLVLLAVSTLFHARAQNSMGLRIGVLVNKIQDCYSQKADYRRQPAAMGAYGFFAWQLKPKWWYIQVEMGYSQRKTRMTDAGVSHHHFSEYDLRQIETNLLGKFAVNIARPRIMLVFGLSTGYAVSGREYAYGYGVGNYTFSLHRALDFDYLLLKRFQIGPVLGLEISHPVFSVGEVLLEGRYAYFPENDLRSCNLPHESRISIGLGYRLNL